MISLGLNLIAKIALALSYWTDTGVWNDTLTWEDEANL